MPLVDTCWGVIVLGRGFHPDAVPGEKGLPQCKTQHAHVISKLIHVIVVHANIDEHDVIGLGYLGQEVEQVQGSFQPVSLQVAHPAWVVCSTHLEAPVGHLQQRCGLPYEIVENVGF